MKQSLLYYRMAIFYGVLFSLNSLFSVTVASFLNIDYENISNTSKFLVIIVILQNWTGTMLAFLNKTMSRVAEDKPLIETGDTAPPFVTEPKQPINK